MRHFIFYFDIYTYFDIRYIMRKIMR